MRSNDGAVRAAITALQNENAEEAKTYLDELRLRYNGRSQELYLLLKDAGWYKALDTFTNDMVFCAFSDGKRVNRLYAQLETLVGREDAKKRLLATFTRFAADPNLNAQRLFKVACYQVHYRVAAMAFFDAGVRIVMPVKYGRSAEKFNELLALTT